MILDKQAEAVLSSVEERKLSSGQIHRVANLLLQDDLYCKATNERKEDKAFFCTNLSFTQFGLKPVTSFP